MGIVNPKRHSEPLFKESDNFSATYHQRKAIPDILIKEKKTLDQVMKEHEVMKGNGYKFSFEKYCTYYRAG